MSNSTSTNNDVVPKLIIGVAGGTGSGKTTLSKRLISELGEDNVAYIQHDSYYRDRSHVPAEEREQINFDHPDALESALLAEHIRKIEKGHSIEVPVYDFVTHTRSREIILVQPRPIVLVEGILILAEPILRSLFDLKIFVDTDDDTRFIRRLQRDIMERGRLLESVINQYQSTVKPMHLEFVEPSKRFADLIIPEGGHNHIAIDVVLAWLRNGAQGKPLFRRKS